MRLDGKTVVVTGCNGFLGSNLMHILKKEGCEVRGVSLPEYDLRKRHDVERAFDNRPDFIFHAAATLGGISWSYDRPGDLFYDNTLMSANILDVAKDMGVKRIINPISNSSYPAHINEKLKESEWWNGPIHESALAFGMARKASWVQAWAYKRQHNLETVSLILPNLYGPYGHFDESRAHALNALVKKFVDAHTHKHKSVTVWGTGKPVREWLYVADGAEAMVEATKIQYTVDPINIGIGMGVSMTELAEIIKNAVGFRGEIHYDHSKPDGVPYKVMDNSRMKDIFTWKPKTDLIEGIRHTVKWYQDHYLK